MNHQNCWWTTLPTAQTLSRYVVRQREHRTVASLDTKPNCWWTILPTAQTLSRYVVRQRERRTVASLDTKPTVGEPQCLQHKRSAVMLSDNVNIEQWQAWTQNQTVGEPQCPQHKRSAVMLSGNVNVEQWQAWTQNQNGHKKKLFFFVQLAELWYTRSSRLISISLLLLLNHSLFDRHFVSLMTRRP